MFSRICFTAKYNNYFTVGEPPLLLEPLLDITIVSPKDAILECDMDVGEPEAEIKWYEIVTILEDANVPIF